MSPSLEIKTKLRVGDIVQVMSGRDRGKTGKVLRLLKKEGRVLVERVQMVSRHLKRTQQSPEGGIRQQEGSIDLSSVALYCSKCARGVRVGVKGAEDSKALVCRKCGSELRKVSARPQSQAS